jgi:hypothetical protein
MDGIVLIMWVAKKLVHEFHSFYSRFVGALTYLLEGRDSAEKLRNQLVIFFFVVVCHSRY